MNAVSAAGGFRLHKIELFNWGIFDGQVHTVTPDGQTTLLIGQNGSGKSTLVDALLTLLVRPGVRNFNVAAGGKKRERDERSYFKGAYDRAGDDAGNGTQVMYLRPKGNHYSVILACFRNRETAKAFTIAQLLYLGSDQSIEKVYCFAEDERSIREDFANLESFEGVLKTLRQRHFRATKKFVEFEEWFTRMTRVKAKAMEVFNQTVAVKDIQRLNDFIRNHMLEQQDWSEKVDRLLGHFTQLSAAYQSLVRVRQQSELLEPVASVGGEYQRQADALFRAERIMAAAETFFSQKILDVFGPALEMLESELNIAVSTKQNLSQEMQSAQDESRRIRNEIEHAGGDRLKQIPILIEVEQTRAEGKRERYRWFKEHLSRAGIDQMCKDEGSFAALRQWVPGFEQELNGSLHQAEASRDDLIVQRGEIRRRLAEHQQELKSLSERRENLPEWCIALRKSLCDDLGLAARDLAFVAELIAVAPGHQDWEASIEKVLRNFAMSVLVPQKLYQVVSRYVERTRLTAQGRGQRLVYLQVGERTAPAAGPLPDVDSMVGKLAFREGHPLLPWVQAELHQRFDYCCCATIEQFWECRGPALTRNRHVKSGKQRHDKDDRDQVIDSRNFILGWDNREKKLRIAAEIERLQQREADLQSRIEAEETRLAVLRTRAASARELLAIEAFTDINFRQHEEKIELLEQERVAIEERSDTIRLLKETLAEVESRYRALLDGRDTVVQREGELKNRISQARRLIANAKLDLENRKKTGEFEQHEEWFSAIDASFSKDLLNVENFFESKDRFRTAREQLVLRLRA